MLIELLDLSDQIQYAVIPIPAIIAGVSALTSLFGNKKNNQTTQEQNNNSSGSTSTQNYNEVNLSGQQQALYDAIAGGALRGGSNTNSVIDSVKAGGLQQINSGGDAARKIADNIVAARGLSFSPAGATQIFNTENNRIQEQNSFLSKLPQLRRDLETQDFSRLLDAFRVLPQNTRSGSATNTTSSQQGTQLVSAPNPSGGIPGAVASFLTPQVSYNNGQLGSTTGLASILSALGLGGGGGSDSSVLPGIGNILGK